MGRSRSSKVDAFKSKIQARHWEISRCHSLTLEARYGTSSAIYEKGDESVTRGDNDSYDLLSCRLRRASTFFRPNAVPGGCLCPRPGFVRRAASQRFLLGR